MMVGANDTLPGRCNARRRRPRRPVTVHRQPLPALAPAEA